MAGLGWLRTGTIAVGNGSRNVGGTDTMWSGGVVSSGDIILLPNGTLGEVESVGSNTALTLKQAYTGATASAQPYAIIRMLPSGNVAADLAAGVQALVQRSGSTLDQLFELLDSNGVVSFSDGTTVLSGLHGLRKLMADVAARLPLAGGALTGPLVVSAPPVSTGVTGAISGPLEVPEVHAGAGGFVPSLHQRTVIEGGYRQHLSIGSYRNGAGWGGGFFVGMGGADDSPTEHFLLGFGGEITHSSGKTFYHSGSSPAFAGPIRSGYYTLATLPAPSAFNGHTCVVSNASGGPALCLSNGTNWINVRTNAPVN